MNISITRLKLIHALVPYEIFISYKIIKLCIAINLRLKPNPTNLQGSVQDSYY